MTDGNNKQILDAINDEFRIEVDDNGKEYLIRMIEGNPTHCVLYEIKEITRDVNRDQCERYVNLTAKERK